MTRKYNQGGLAPYGLRHSGEGVKGKGYFGPMAGRDGTVTELSAEDESGEFPLVVPTLTAEELDRLLAGGEPTPEMLDKASSWAATRRKRGESPFASPTEVRMPRPKAEGGSVYSPRPGLVFVGQEHGAPADVPQEIRDLANQVGAFYEGSGGDKLPDIRYRGSWDDAASRSVKGYPPEYLYTIFTNTDVNKQKDALVGDGTIFNNLLKNQQQVGYFKDRRFNRKDLANFLQSMGPEFLRDSQNPATESNVEAFLRRGEQLMWESGDTPARQLADKANESRQRWLLNQPKGVFFMGSDHLQKLKELHGAGKKAPAKKAEGGAANLTDLPDEVNPSNWREHLQNNVLADARALLGAKDGGVINLDELIEKSLKKKDGGVINLDELIAWTLAKDEHRKMKEGGAVKMQGGGNPGEVAGDMFKPKPLSIPEPITSLVEALRRQFEKEKRSMSKPGAVQDVLMRGPVAAYAGAPADILGMGGELLDYAQKKIPALRKPASVMDTGPEKTPPMGYAPMFPLSPEGSYGTAATQELFGKAGLTTKEERPLAELTTGVLAPFAVSPTIKAAKAAGKALAPTATDFLDLQLGNLMKPYQMSVVPEGGPKLSKEEYSRMMREKYAAQNLAKQEKAEVSLKPEEVKAPADDLGLYSPAEKAALNLKRNIGTGEAFLSDLRKAPDVGETDLLHTGLEDWLKSKKTVSKQEIQDYINANRVRMRQRELSGEGVSEDMQFGRPETIDDYDYINSEAEYYIDNIDDYHPGFLDEAKERLTQKAIDDGDDVSDPRVQSWIESSAQEELANYANDMARDMYYDNPYRRWSNNAGYEIIGNDDVGYTVRSPNGDVVNRREVYDFETAEGIAQSHGMDNGYGGAGSTQYSEYQLAGPSSNYREHLTQIDRTVQRALRENELNDLARQMNQATDPIEKDRLLGEYNRLKEDVYEIYSGAHHDYEDIMSHSRTQDRVSDEGKNILHVDELQSDMHQDGAEFGYKTPELKQREKTLINEREAVIDQFQEARDKLQELIDARERAAYRMSTDINNLPLQKEYEAAKAKVEQLGAKRDSLTNEIKDIEKAVPDAPFKKDWAEKEFKKLLTLAAKEGKDGITLSRWQDQLERWGTDSLAFRKTKTGEWVISGSKYRRLSKADLDDTITPKDVAEIMFAREGEYDCNSKEGLRDFVKKNLARGWSNAHIDRVTNKAWEQMQNLKPGEMAAIDPRKEGFKATYGKAYVEMMQKMARKYGGKMTTAKIDKGDEIIEVPYIEISGNLLKSAKKGFPYKKGGAVSKADLEREYRMAFGGGVFNTDPDITDSGRIIPEHTI